MRILSKFSPLKVRRAIPTRLKIGLMLFVGSFTTYMMRSNFSIIILAMTETFTWTNYEQNLLLGAFFCGYVGPNLIAGIAVDYFGGRMLNFYVLFFSAVVTALSPLCASNNFHYLFAARLLLGFCGGFFFCTCHNLISLWAPPEEKGMFVSSMLGSKLGVAVTWPLMGFCISAYGWKSAFYVTAAVNFIVAYFWFEIVADSPDKHLKINKSEKEFIEDSLALITKKKEVFPPLDKMFKSPPFYSLCLLHFSDVWGVFFLLTSAPMFMKHALEFDIKNAGVLSSLPYIARMICGFLFGIFGDYLMSRGVGTTKIRKLFCLFSHIIPGLLLFGFYFIEKNPYACIALITIALGFNGASVQTSSANPQDLAPNYAATVFGFTNFFATMSGFISPLVVSYFTSEKSTMNEWRSIFILDGILYIVTAIVFMIFGSGEVQKWNRRDSLKSAIKV